MSKQTTYLQRFGDAMTLLCGGKRPPDALMINWLDRSKDDFDLQEFAIEHGPRWAQGIVVIDAARSLADRPEEGYGHEEIATTPRDTAAMLVEHMTTVRRVTEASDTFELRNALSAVEASAKRMLGIAS